MTKTDNNITVKGAGIIAENKEERGRLEVSANAESSISVISTCSTDSDDNRPKSGLAALEPRFLAELKRLEPNYKDMSFIIAFSGGRDSLALAHLMKRAIVPENLTLLHLDHKIREESLKDAHECLNLAEGLGLRFVLKTKDVLELAKERGKGVEEAGRAARYEALEEERRQRNANYIVTAHHADDLSETMLFNLIRGAGPGGFKGIASKSHNIIRPLLPILRDEITKALTEEKLSWIEDASNLSHKHKRNFLRLEVLPLLIELNPKLKEAFWRLSVITDAEEDFWDKTLDGLMSSLVHQKGPNRFE
ncbi:MAG: tRNA lysidine(34) synthetase TilS, partial [Deltaproteobacteria bacterium]|nr:tRNA lysidine(34) synthetase TilS [Deltaproteobacteria bacterium]